MAFRILQYIAAGGIFAIMALTIVVIYLAGKAKNRRIREEMDNDEPWLESLDDDEWYCGEDSEEMI